VCIVRRRGSFLHLLFFIVVVLIKSDGATCYSTSFFTSPCTIAPLQLVSFLVLIVAALLQLHCANSTGFLFIIAAARLTTGARKYDHVMPLLKDLHWLRVPERITYKLCVLVHNCLHGTAPRYLQDVIQPVAVTSRRRLRSTSSSALVVPVTRRTTIGDRAFAVAGPRAWNSLPQFVTDCPSPGTFRQYLKTYLFSL